MGVTLSGLVNIGASSVKAHQAAIAVTSHNIANSGTVGYARQRADLTAAHALQTPQGQFGSGVEVTSVSQQRSALIDAAVRGEVGSEARYDELSSGLSQLDAIMTSNGEVPLNTAMSNFFSGLQGLLMNPESLSARQSTISAGAALAGQFNRTIEQFDAVSTSLDKTVQQAATDVSSKLGQIADLNRAIALSEPGSGSANDLRDQRGQLLEQLSGFMELDVTDAANGAVDVSVNGVSLVSGFTAAAVSAVDTGSQNELQAGGVSLTTSKGRLQGIADTYAAVSSARANINSVAAALISEVNAVHAAPSAAFDLDGNQGIAFFSGTDAASISVNPTVAADPRKVAAASINSKGDNGVTLALIKLQTKKVAPLGNPVETLSDAVTTIATSVGSAAQDADAVKSLHSSALEGWRTRQQSVSGVNMDEELSNLVGLQHAYEAAARVISMVDEMMDTVVNRMGAGH